MRCNWKALLSILPARLRQPVDNMGKNSMNELRCRLDMPPELVTDNGYSYLKGEITREELDFIVNTASKYSPWNSSSVANGYLTAPGGHRIGVCGEVVYKNNQVVGMKSLDSICIRIARDFPGICRQINWDGMSILILGAPGCGKTTLLRDLIRNISEYESISVVDERGELFPEGFYRGTHTDVLTGCPKILGIERMLRTMSPSYIAVDEITSESDSHAVVQASNCGVRLLATAHACSIEDFMNRSAYHSLVQNKVFQMIVILKRNKSYVLERFRYDS